MKRKILIFPLISFLLFLYILPVYAVSYTVPNGDFEIWNGGTPDDWTSGWDSTQEITIPAYVHGDSSAVNLTTATNGVNIKTLALIEVNPDASYTAAFWILDNDTDGVVWIEVIFYKEDISYAGSAGGANSDNDNYVQHSAGFTTPSDCAYVELRISAASVTGTFSVYADDYTLDGPVLPEFSAPLIVILSGFLIVLSVFLYKKKQK
ncbi:MAG: hypothetical protein ACXAC7_15625 [Candidatus Hodarchaeales archaeon]|jgi:hypothetical protein